MRSAIAGGLFSVVMMASTAHATTNIALGATVVANSTSVTYGDGGNPSAIVDGITGDSTTGSGVSYWVGQDYQFGNTETGYVTIDLGGTYNITGFTLTDTHNAQYFDRGTKDFVIGVGASASDALLNATGGNAAATSAFSLTQWQQLTDLTVGTSATGRYVTFYALTDWSNDPNAPGGDGTSAWPTRSAGLSELQVAGTLVSAVPEPISMAILGTGLVGLLAMRRRNV